MSNDLVQYRTIPPHELKVIKDLAPLMSASRLFGTDITTKQEKAAVVMLIGYELGFSPALAFQYIDIIQNKPSLKPKGMMALIHKSGLLEEMTIDEEVNDKGYPQKCTVYMKRKGGIAYKSSFSIQDAQNAGLIKNEGGWDKYPANMLRWRAISYCAAIVFPDVIGGMLTSEELGAAITPEGDTIIDSDFEEVTPQEKPVDLMAEYSALGEQYGYEALLNVSTTPPSTVAELEAIRHTLQGQS